MEVGTDGKMAYSTFEEDILGEGSLQSRVFRGVYRETAGKERPAAIKVSSQNCKAVPDSELRAAATHAMLHVRS